MSTNVLCISAARLAAPVDELLNDMRGWLFWCERWPRLNGALNEAQERTSWNFLNDFRLRAKRLPGTDRRIWPPLPGGDKATSGEAAHWLEKMIGILSGGDVPAMPTTTGLAA